MDLPSDLQDHCPAVADHYTLHRKEKLDAWERECRRAIAFAPWDWRGKTFASLQYNETVGACKHQQGAQRFNLHGRIKVNCCYQTNW